MNKQAIRRTAQRTILKQSMPRLWLGALRDMVQRTQSYYAIINISLLLITTYTVRETTIKTYFPWFNFLWLLAIGVVFVLVVAIVDYKFVYPSQIAFHQHEAWKHMSPVRKDLGVMKEELASMKASIELIEAEVCPKKKTKPRRKTKQ